MKRDTNGIMHKGFVIVAAALLGVLIWVVKDTKTEVTKLSEAFHRDMTEVKVAIARLEEEKRSE